MVYAAVGFVAGACPSTFAATSSHQHHHGKASHTIGCAWACQGSADHGAFDAISPWVPTWLVLTWLFFIDISPTPAQFVAIAARAPPFPSPSNASRQL